MKHKERVIKALNNEVTDRPPFQATFTPEFAERLRLVLGIESDIEHDPHSARWNTYDLELAMDHDALQCTVGWSSHYYENREEYTDEWGVVWKCESYETPYGDGYYTNVGEGPLEDESKIDAYQAPDPTRPELYTNLKRLIAEYGEEYYIIGRLHTTIYESAWALRGMTNLMMDFLMNPEAATKVLDITFNYHLEVAKQMVREGVNMVWLGDDMGGQEGMILDPSIWREYFKPRMETLIVEMKKINPDVKVAYHTDGNVYDIIPDLIEIGLDVLNPIQAECMDPKLLQDEYGDKLQFFGGINVQSTLPFGTPEEVSQEFKDRLATLGKNGGWLCAPTHHLQLDTPMKNIYALLDAVGTEYQKPDFSKDVKVD